MTWELPDGYDDFRASCRAFVDAHLRPIVDAAELDPSLSLPAWRAAGEAGLMGLTVSSDVGGADADLKAVVVLAEELARASGGLAITALGSSYMAAPHIVLHGSEEQKKRYLPEVCSGESLVSILVSEPGAGSDVAALTSTAVPDHDGSWILNGSKMFITNASLSSIWIVAARTDQDARHRGITTFLVDPKTPGISWGNPLPKMGWHASDTREVYLDDVRIPADAVLGEVNHGFYQTMAAFQEERTILAAMAVGHAVECLALSRTYAREREVFGQKLIDLQSVRHTLARMEIALETARAAVYRAADRIDRQHPEAHRSVAVAKYHAANVANEVADSAVQLFGGMGFVEGTGVARHYRDARILRIGGGTDEVQLEILSRLGA
ncbi:acyl-CoA dehydrogenase family protein [Nocardioides ginsengisoli]|uniref:Acyl-CoA dehydrogenase family protein n=1 Tax=Nocardioides ginsengisoli TaxID=363868 RepID=A0ABW3VWV0_9ACTN